MDQDKEQLRLSMLGIEINHPLEAEKVHSTNSSGEDAEGHIHLHKLDDQTKNLDSTQQTNYDPYKSLQNVQGFQTLNYLSSQDNLDLVSHPNNQSQIVKVNFNDSQQDFSSTQIAK